MAPYSGRSAARDAAAAAATAAADDAAADAEAAAAAAARNEALDEPRPLGGCTTAASPSSPAVPPGSIPFAAFMARARGAADGAVSPQQPPSPSQAGVARRSGGSPTAVAGKGAGTGPGGGLDRTSQQRAGLARGSAPLSRGSVLGGSGVMHKDSSTKVWCEAAAMPLPAMTPDSRPAPQMWEIHARC
jgi:hypothetical protein